MGRFRVCRCFTRKFKVTESDPPYDVEEAFEQYSDGGIHMTADQLLLFIQERQGGSVSKSDAEHIVEQVHKRYPITCSNKRKTLTLQDFHHYLFDSELNPPIGSQVHQDMTGPLSHYFIYTGHNTYSTVNQTSSPCSDVLIIEALKQGVRAIELDLWPNSSRDNVHVRHGSIPTTLVELIRCLKSIKEHAFTASPYPVVIALEVHLTTYLQEKVVQMFRETFEEMLFIPGTDDLKDLPSPQSLKRKIILSSKPPKEYLEDGMDKRIGSQRYESDEYMKLIAVHAGEARGGLEEALRVGKDKVRLLNLTEQALEKAAERHRQDLIRFTQKSILRVYPKDSRFTSSSYKPLIGWLLGAQMIAFNMQEYGRPLWLMHGMFRANGGCGYVRKPDFMMTRGPNNEVFDYKALRPVKMSLKVEVYMGDGWHLDFKPTHFDAYSPPNFYTRVAISGAPADEIVRTTTPKEKTWTPVWNEVFEFHLTLPEIALLRIEVHEDDTPGNDGLAGQTCLPVSELRPGIRAVPLCDHEGCQYTATRLLMRFEFVS